MEYGESVGSGCNTLHTNFLVQGICQSALGQAAEDSSYCVPRAGLMQFPSAF
jgi:hypothetical protein